ncbi:hypothetical protein Daus18300_000549 [Diaporthe australafricana]|uniref:DUF4470 domain-containing protein n=1 Tax=Diaporthe australafricana TaxID=127596 RepID=A0ABR3Y4R7_9PEZI
MASALRERGNSLYKQGKLQEAIKCYEEAASLAPEDPAPISNLSAAKFEMGKYGEAAELAKKALSITGGDSPSRDKLYLRLARCYLHGLKTQQARAALEKCSDSEMKAAIAQSLMAIDSMHRTAKKTKRLRRDVLDRLPRQDEPEYYLIGHDEAESLFDSSLQEQCKPGSSLSFLFCGIGDARHLLPTLNQIVLHKGGQGDVPKELHITLVDLKSAALARILILLRLLSQLPTSEGLGSPALQDATLVIVYLYIGHVMPPFAHEALLRTISELIRVLEKKSAKSPLLKWIVMSDATRVQVLEHLRHWSRPLDKLYRPENVRKLVEDNVAQDHMIRRMANGLVGDGPPPPTCEEDDAIFNQFTITPPPAAFIRRHEPEIGKLLDLARSARTKTHTRASSTVAVDEYINRYWKTNVTMMDFEWEAKKDRNNDLGIPSHLEWQRLPALEGDPVSLLHRIMGGMNPEAVPGQNGVVGIMGSYFFVVGHSLQLIRSASQLRVELIAGEMTDIMERLRYGCLDDRSYTGSSLSFPRTFDRIHMSNILDYVGGILGPLEYARPLLKDKASSFQFNCLLNPPRFKSQEHLLSEYALMSSKEQVRDHFCAELFDQYDGMLEMPGMEFYSQNYWAWKPAGDTSELPWKKLMPRARLERWLYAHFLKICLPAKRDPENGAPVYAPLNLTAFMRLVLRLSERGYPAHWLGTVMENLTSGFVKTTARAPRKEVLDVEDVDTAFPLRQMSVAPWAAEFSTLVSIWRGLMPFGFTVANGAQVSLADIYEYTVTFQDFRGKNLRLRVPHFILVFYNTELGKMPQSLRNTLLDDEVGDKSEQAKKARAEGLHVVATFTYVTDTRTASFWMRRDVADELCRGRWNVSIWRTDSWGKQVGDVLASSHMVRGKPWS